MRIAKVVGTVTLNRAHDSFHGARLRLAVPYTLDDLLENAEPQTDSVVVYDELGAGAGNLVIMSEGPEAAQPFRPDKKPVDAYNAGIVDEIHFAQQRNA